jgi:hypothetical protein
MLDMNSRRDSCSGTVAKRRRALLNESSSVLVLILSFWGNAAAQQPLVCPLSESQTQKSIEAFEPVAAAFTQEDRCANCHGGVNPFTPDGHHAGEARERSSDPDGCQECHSGLKGWTIPVSGMFFVDGYRKPRKASVICEQMKSTFLHGARFVKHISGNTDSADFNGLAFAGTRGLNGLGQTLAFTDPYRDEKPSISREEMTRRAQAWVDAMGGEFKGDKDCGCEPVHYAIRLSDTMNTNLPMVSARSLMGPVDIPIQFKDDGSFQTEQRVTREGTAAAVMCSGQFNGAMTLRVSGKATEEYKNNHMHLQIENITPEQGTASASCPQISVTRPLGPGEHGMLSKEMEGRVGEALIYSPAVSGGISVVVRAEIVKK